MSTGADWIKMGQVNTRRLYKIFLFCALFLLIIFCISALYLFLPVSNRKPVVINEICSNNFSLMQDDTGQYLDYIELYNPTDEPVSLEGYFLSDDENRLQKFPLEPVIISPKGYYVVWLAGGTVSLEDIDEGTSLGFGISKYGETIYLSTSDSGEIIDEITIPELKYNTCYGRVEDGGVEWAIMSGTAGGTNADAERIPAISLTAPVFSAESGFYKEPFELTITAAEGDTVYYTLDGSDPTPDSYVYQTPIVIEDVSQKENVYISREDLSPGDDYIPSFPVDKAVILRAASYNDQNDAVSKTVTKIYFIGYDDKTEYDNFPVVSVVTDPDNLFDEETGIYGNGVALKQYKEEGGVQNGKTLPTFTDQDGRVHQHYEASNAFNTGREWEREASLTYFDGLHNLCFEQNVGIRIAGESTRAGRQKSLSIYGREIYGENILLPYAFFPDTSYSTIKLRNGGNNDRTVMITDAFLEELAEGRDVSIQRATPCVLFLNGEYWGIYNIRERYKGEYLSSHYGVGEDNVWIIQKDRANVGGEEAQTGYQFMIDVLTECDVSYDDVFDMICGIIDVQSLIDYCCINLYVGNTDVSFKHNIALWRTIEPEEGPYGDGKWRWMHYDMDISLRKDKDISWINEYSLMNEPAVMSILKNEQFRKQFCISFMDIANTNYAYDLVHEKLMEWEKIYTAQVVKKNQSFFDGEFTEEAYHEYIMEIDDFFKDRFPFAMESLAYTFGLSGNLETITVENNIPEGGTVSVNTALLNDFDSWSGQYFTDYPITLTAFARDGYQFVRWGGDIDAQDNTVEIELSGGGLRVEAIFEKVD